MFRLILLLSVIYILQKEAESDGTFLFSFKMPASLPAGQYEYEIGSDSDAPNFTGVIDYGGWIVYVDRKAFDFTASVIIENYTPTLAFEITPEYDNEILLTIKNKTDNTMLENVRIQNGGETYTNSFVLPNLISNKTYTVTLDMINKEKSRASMSFEIDTSIVYSRLSADINLSDKMSAFANVDIVGTSTTSKSVSIDSSKNYSVYLPNIIANSEFYIEASVEETVVKEPIKNINSRYEKALYTALKSACSVLDPDNDGVIEFSELSQISGVLDLSSGGLADIEGLQYCTEITGLYLDNNYISDLSYLYELDNLEILSASNNNISQINKLPKNLKILNIDNNELSSVIGLLDCDKLEILLANDNDIAFIMSLRNKPMLKRLEMKGNLINDISTIKNSNNLEHIDLSDNQIENVEVLSGKQNLKYLNLSNNEIADVSNLPLLPYHILILSGNNIDEEDASGFNAVYKKILPQN